MIKWGKKLFLCTLVVMPFYFHGNKAEAIGSRNVSGSDQAENIIGKLEILSVEEFAGAKEGSFVYTTNAFEGKVTADVLNVREAPDEKSEKATHLGCEAARSRSFISQEWFALMR